MTTEYTRHRIGLVGSGTRHAIGEAMGILMERHQLGEDEAFGVLRRISQDHNLKLRDVARRVRADSPDRG